MKTIRIDPVTRLEGHARIDIFLEKSGRVDDCRLVVPELRGFEKFVEGRPVEELPRITSRICGVCPEAHQTAGAKAVEAVYQATIPEAAEVIRRLQYNAFVAADHATHFYALGGPDFIVGPKAKRDERNLLGVIAKVGQELGLKVMQMRKLGHEVSEMLGGRRIHSVGMVVGGQSKAVTPSMRDRLVEIGRFMVDFAQLTQKVFADRVLANEEYVDLVRSETYQLETHYMALVNEKDQVDHYDGFVRVVDPQGDEIARYPPDDYLSHVAERVESWSYLKFPYLRVPGWRGFTEGRSSGVYRVAPLGMLNASEGMQTPLAQVEYERFYATLGKKPIHATLAYHWARIIEMLQCAELTLEHAQDERLTDPRIRVLPTQTPKEGVGVVEAPRGILTHHYVTDDRGIVQKANLIVGTTNNHASIQMSVKKAAEGLVQEGADEPVLNMVEMALRAYDPCFGCATHSLPGQMPLRIDVYDCDGRTVRTIRRE